MLDIRLIDGYLYGDFIIQAKVETQNRQSVRLASSLVEPVPYGNYFGAFHKGEIVGFLESFAYRDAFASYEESPYYTPEIDFGTICPFDKMVHTRTVYLKEEFRKTLNFFSLCIVSAKHSYDMGHRYTTLGTAARENPYLNTLYRKMGAGHPYTLSFANSSGDFTMYILEIARLITHPMAGRIHPEAQSKAA